MPFHRSLLAACAAMVLLPVWACAPAADEKAGSGDEMASDGGSGAGADPASALPGDNEEAPDESEGEAFVIADTGWLTIGTDGAVQTTYFDADGRYRDLRNGEPAGEGAWRRGPEGRVCFVPDAGRGACWTTEDVDDEGEATATDGEGRTIAIRRIAYLPPEDEDGEGGEDAERR
ncbi:MAG: hypothetical protein WA985_00940 [Erythrobacter sp.]